jgi:hypothetical protein
VKIHGSRYGRVGDPDIWGCAYGKMFLLEIKVPGRKPTRAQLNELRQWQRAGAVTGWFDTFDAAINLVRSLLPRAATSSRAVGLNDSTEDF